MGTVEHVRLTPLCRTPQTNFFLYLNDYFWFSGISTALRGHYAEPVPEHLGRAEAAEHPAAFPATAVEEGRGEAAAREGRAHRAVQPVTQATAFV